MTEQSFASNVLLAHINNEAKLTLMVVASNIAVGSVLEQPHYGETVPITFFPKNLIGKEFNLKKFNISTIKSETLCCNKSKKSGTPEVVRNYTFGIKESVYHGCLYSSFGSALELCTFVRIFAANSP
uniref:RT_RNaseH_2 domain-containing protein n=1 Tax=Glossina austeni TaxID=7395 RepID=A0A1A9VQI7_GLOAU